MSCIRIVRSVSFAKTAWSAAFMGSLLLFAACTATNQGSGTASCTPNAQQSCACAGGGSGVQTCDAAGTAFSTCACGSGGGGGGGGSGGDDGGGTAGGGGCGSTATFLYEGKPCNGTSNTATLDISLSGNQVTAQRSPLTGATDNCTYTGTMSADCTSITGGTYTCTGAGGGSGEWSATVTGGQCASGGCGIGTSWAEQEMYTGSNSCDATWAPACPSMGTFIYNGKPCNGTSNTATLAVTVNGNQVTVHRTPLTGATDTCTYSGTITSDCASVSGTYTCTGAGGGSGTWSATITGGQCASGGGCGIGTSWAEQEMYTGSNSCGATWTPK